MEKIILSALISILPFTQLSHPHEEDPFTTYIQEKLIELGYLEVATGVNDKTSQSAIKLFQEKYGLIVDGIVGEQTFTKLLLAEAAYQTPETTSKQIEETNSPTIDTLAPVWDEEQPPYASEIGSLFNLNMPAVTDNVGIVSYEVYVNGALSTYATISDSTLLVTPKYDMTCADQLIYVIAFDEAGNSSQSPTFTIPQTDPCISTVNSSQSSSSSQISSTSYAVTFGGTSTDFPSNVVVDSLGNAYITGDFHNTVNFGSGNITSSGVKDIFIAKFNSTGSLEWVKTYGDSSFDRGLDIAIDSSDNIYVTGYFMRTVNFGGGNVTVTDPSSGGSDLFVLKLNSSGEFQWVYTVGGSNNDNGKGIDVDSSGNVYISGIFKDTVNFGGGDITSHGNFDIFVLKLNSSGVFQWVYHAGGTGNDQAYPISVDTNGNVLVAGYFFDTANFTPASCTSRGSADIFVLKLTTSGLLNFIRCYGSTSVDYPWGVDFDSAGNAYITGGFSNTINFDCGNTTSSGSQDIFVMKLNSSGNCQWVYTVGDSDMDYGWALETDSSNNSYITGYFQDTVNFGGGNITSVGNRDVFVLKLNSSGVFQWVYTAGGTEDDYSYGLDIDSSGNIYAVGSFQSTINFGGGNITSEGSYDVFAVKLNSSGQYSD